MRGTLAFIIIALVLGSALSANSFAATDSSGPVSVTGPSSVAINSTFNYSVSVQQIFSSYSITMIISGYNLTGASPISPDHLNDIRAGPTVFNVTAPSGPTTMFILFQVVGNMSSGERFTYNVTLKVLVKHFTTLKTTLKNTSNFTMSDINVTFDVNGKYVGSEVVNVSANSSQNVSYEWVSGILPAGIYSVSVRVNNSFVTLQDGNSYTFQIQSGNPFLIYIYIGIIAFFAIIIAVMFIASYYARKRRPKWKK